MDLHFQQEKYEMQARAWVMGKGGLIRVTLREEGCPARA